MMIWQYIFLIGVFQGLFLITLLLIKHQENKQALITLCLIISCFTITNIDYFLTISQISYRFLGISFGNILLIGPLLLLYTRSITQQEFRISIRHLPHFIPYLLNVVYNSGLYIADTNVKLQIVTLLSDGKLPIGSIDKSVFWFQCLHLIAYIYIAAKSASSLHEKQKKTLQVSIDERQHWLKKFRFIVFLYLFIVLSSTIYISFQETYHLSLNYAYTIASMVIILAITAGAFLRHDILFPTFAVKYNSYVNVDVGDMDIHRKKLIELMEIEKMFLDPELRISHIAEKLSLPSYMVSKLINESFKKSFNEFVNEYRVREFVLLVNNPAYEHLSLHGLSLEVGFNSKSSFNLSVKKLTGRTPSDFRTPNNQGK